MLVVCPYVQGMLRPETKRSLDSYTNGHANYVELRGFDDYFDLLVGLWAGGRSVILIEHDVEVHEQALRSMKHCKHRWCAYPYKMTGENGYRCAHGCVKFSARMMEEYPSLMEDVYESPGHYRTFERRSNPFDFTSREVDPDGSKYWATLDTRVYNALAKAQFERHEHWPPVMHWSLKQNPELEYPPEWAESSTNSQSSTSTGSIYPATTKGTVG